MDKAYLCSCFGLYDDYIGVQIIENEAAIASFNYYF
jgi:hypothetical protein